MRSPFFNGCGAGEALVHRGEIGCKAGRFGGGGVGQCFFVMLFKISQKAAQPRLVQQDRGRDAEDAFDDSVCHGHIISLHI